MARMRIGEGNRPHRGHGLKGKPKRMGGLMGVGAHVPQRTNTGFDDRRGYKNTPALPIGRESGKAPKVSKAAGHYHPISTQNARRGYDQDVTRTRKLQQKDHDERDQGRHTGREARADTRRRNGPEGNGVGSPPPGVGAGKGVRGSPASHMGTAGRGGPGKMGKGDGHKGRPRALSEDISHDQFEKLGAD